LWDNRYQNDIGNDCLVSVDGTDFRCRGRKLLSGKPDKHYYTPKFKGPGYRYEVALCIRTSDIVWIAGPYLPGVYNDLMIFRNWPDA